MRISSLIILFFLLVSCGSRLKLHQSSSNQLSETNSELEAIKVQELYLDKAELLSKLYKLNFRASSIESKPDGTLLLTDVELATEEEIDTNSSDNSIVIDKESKSERIENKEEDITENSSKSKYSQYNWWYGLPALLIFIGSIYILYYFYKKSKKWT